MSDRQSAYPDRLKLIGLRFSGRHGANPGEQDEPQSFEVDVVLHADLSRAAESDELRDTVDYGPVAEVVRRIVEGASVALIERLAGQIADEVLRTSEPAVVRGVEVSVRKLEAPLEVDLDTVEVTVVRRRDD